MCENSTVTCIVSIRTIMLADSAVDRESSSRQDKKTNKQKFRPYRTRIPPPHVIRKHFLLSPAIE